MVDSVHRIPITEIIMHSRSFVNMKVCIKTAAALTDCGGGFYELGDLSNENSELVRILKECVAELNEDDTVTE